MAKNDHDISDDQFDAEMQAARRRYERRRETGLVAQAVRYNKTSGTVAVDLLNGISFRFPADALEALRDADAAALADVSVDPMGVGLRWNRLDVDYDLAGILRTLFSASWAMRELARIGGGVRSAAKARASRANGAKGGRPRTRAGGRQRAQQTA